MSSEKISRHPAHLALYSPLSIFFFVVFFCAHRRDANTSPRPHDDQRTAELNRLTRQVIIIIVITPVTPFFPTVLTTVQIKPAVDERSLGGKVHISFCNS